MSPSSYRLLERSDLQPVIPMTIGATMNQNYPIKFIWLLCAGLLLAGCSTVTEARRVQQAEALPPGQRTVKASEIGLTRDTVLTLDKTVGIALQYNPAVAQSRERLASAQSQLAGKKGGYYPQVSGSISSQKSTNDTLNSNSYSTGLSLSQYVYDFDKTDSQVRLYYHDALAAEYDLAQARNSVIYSVKEAYYNVLRQVSAVRLAEETVRQNEKYLEQARTFFEVGTKIRYDITKAEVNLGNAQLSLINARNALFVNRQILNNVLGLAENPEYRLDESPVAISGAGTPAEPTETLFQTATANNPELKAQHSRVESAGAGVDNAVAALWPSLSLSASYSFSGNSFPLDWTRAVTALLAMDLFKSGQKMESIKSATANLKSARTALSSLEQRIFLDITRAKTQMLDATQKLEVNRKILQQAEENLNFIEQRYRTGKASAIELTDAQVSLTKARENIIQAQFDYLIASSALEKIVGGYK
ncbi:MAG: TolC family protein [Planctomycetes bacterium]|nr:TolC family protein [Planctomycetota bacterium]